MKAKTTIFSLIPLLAFALEAQAATRLVPGQYPNIQAAVDASTDDDTVIVAPGAYTGEGNRDIDFKGKAITVRSEDGPENCIIDCQGSDKHPRRGLYFRAQEGPDSVLDGFTITNGWVGYGGGISCIGESSLIITNCTLSGNTAGYASGGMYIDGDEVNEYLRFDDFCEF